MTGGKLIMACGTGKTFTALRIAEAVVKVGGTVLLPRPIDLSIPAINAGMGDASNNPATLHRICSDTRAGRNDEDAALQELEIPVTTNPGQILKSLQFNRPDAMTVVFCTYHSLGLVQQAQDAGAPPLDLVLCDEAHRTTGIERPGDKASPFVMVHNEKKIRAAKRLYMTATPRLYTEGAKSKAAHHNVEVFSMDDPETYGPEFHRLPFSKAVEQGLLSDYKVVVLAVSEEHVDSYLQAHLAHSSGLINLDDAAKIVGCWQALQNPENRRTNGAAARPLRRAIAFSNTIMSSERLEKHWDGIVEQAIALLPQDKKSVALRCEDTPCRWEASRAWNARPASSG